MDLGKKVNINVQGNEDTSVDVNLILGKSIQYQDLLDQLETNEKLLSLTPEEKTEERLKISNKINGFKDQIKQFKQDVIQLAEQFQNIEINTERLKQAKEFFDKGEIGEARAILESDLEQMNDEYSHLMQQKEKFENEILPNLKKCSDEFFILAISKQTDYSDSNWLQNTCSYFEKSIEAYSTKENVFQYALFLQQHNQFAKAENYYQRYLDDFSANNSLSDVATTLNNLANLHQAKNEYEDALKEYEEALGIYRKLAEENPSTYLPDVAMTLNNLANLHQAKNEYEDALKEYEEALEIRRKLAEENRQVYIIDVAQCCYNLSNFYRELDYKENSIKFMTETVSILIPIAERVPYTQKYLQIAIASLKDWGLSEQDIIKLIAEKLEIEKD